MTVWLLGLDIGQRKTGVAVGQTLTGSATPLGIVRKPAMALQITDFHSRISEWRVQAVVVGRPQLADGRSHPLDSAIDRVIRLIKSELNLPVHEVDEYLSSHEARQRRSGTQDIDDMAACVLLEDFFAQTGNAGR